MIAESLPATKARWATLAAQLVSVWRALGGSVVDIARNAPTPADPDEIHRGC